MYAVVVLAVLVPSATVAFTVVPRVPSPGPQYDRWLVNAFEFNAAPFLVPACGNCTSMKRPSCGDVYFAYNSTDALAAANEALDAGFRRLQARSGRHSYLASGATTTDAAVIDVSNISTVSDVFQVPCNESTAPCYAAYVGPGVKLFDLYLHLGRQGFMFPGGSCPTVGVGGFTLGGGIGLWSRMHGLASDNVLAVDLLVPDIMSPSTQLRLIHVTNDTNPELFKAIRGGGNNNFGIVVNITLRVFEAPSVLSRWRINFANFTACRTQAIPLFQAGIEDPWLDATDTGSHRVAIAFDVYQDACAAIVVGFNVTAERLVAALKVRGWLAINGSSVEPVEGPYEQPWLEGVTESEGCKSIQDCIHRVATELPNPAKPGRWQALTSFVTQPLNETETERLFTAINAASRLNDTWIVAIVDMLGGAVNRSSLDVETSFVHHTALFHVQLLAYLSDSTYETSEEAWQWALGVLAVLDDASRRAGNEFSGAYRNYPSLRLPSANLRYFGVETLSWLRSMKRAVDPNGFFTYDQGL